MISSEPHPGDAHDQYHVLRHLIDSVPALIGHWGNDLRNIAANQAYLDYFGLTPDQVRGMHIRDVLGESVYELNRPYLEGVLAGERQQFDRTLIDSSGGTRYTQATYIPDVVDGRVEGFFVHVSDVSPLVLARRERDEAVTLFEKSMEFAPIGKAVLDTNGNWLQVNRALCDITGYTEDELRRLTFHDITHPDDVEAADQHLRELLDGTRRQIQSEKRYLRKDGSVVWVQRNAVIVRSPDGMSSDIIIAQIQDITRRKSAEEELARQAVTDALTGLGNRYSLLSQIDAMSHVVDHGIGLLFIDLDEFKTINDHHGHSVGDELLVAVADRISESIREFDFACRIGGDEFVVMVHRARSASDVEAVRRRLETAVSTSYSLPSLDEPIAISASVGSSWSGEGAHAGLLRAADEHMYREKVSRYRDGRSAV